MLPQRRKINKNGKRWIKFLIFFFIFPGDGIQSVVGGNLAPRPPFNGTNLFVPGTGSAGNKQINLVLSIIALCTIYLFL